MRQPSSRPATARKRASRHSHCPNWRIVEPTLSPMLTPEQVAAANAADLARQQRAPRRPRPPQQCTIGSGPGANDTSVPAVRLSGRWLEELGFAIGQKVHVRVRRGELVVSVAAEG
ncbi:type I toxin-antitoxin system SymE family toxin [Xanthomonas sp. AmX2]|uniref:SymE family type I addiction module toxin n=1 Tax=Xanthomonas sp. TaxID=29446 RepID=UPI001980A516|nr:SymE family type I addiction module toxin [Xanthomonas sp.]MBN6150467.1 type I toxin-antitoxin system SymE family toxin [Xanthomonas sp.]